MQRLLLAERQRAGRLVVKQARRFLARECNCPGTISLDLGFEACDVEGLPGDLMVHPRAGFRKIGEADAQFKQCGELVRFMSAGRDPGLVQRAPKAVARMGVVVADAGGSRAGRRANKDEAEVGAKAVGQAMVATVGHVDERNATSTK